MADDYGITPTPQDLLDVAAHAVRDAIAATERALEAADERSDACRRCDESLRYLMEALVLVQWTPQVEH